MQNARTLAAHIVVLATQDSLVTGKLAKVSENGSIVNEFIKIKDYFHAQSQRKVVSKLKFSVLVNIMSMGIVNGEPSVLSLFL